MLNNIIIAILFLQLITAQAKRPTIFFPQDSSNHCQTKLGERGWCKPIGECLPVQEKIRFGIMPSHCQFSGKMPIVCCPITFDLLTRNHTNVISKPDEVPSPNPDIECGIRGKIVTRQLAIRKRSPSPAPLAPLPKSDFKIQVVGGDESIKNSWPWMVLLGRSERQKNNFFCSGMILNDKYVITAAHCALDNRPFFARLGEHDYTVDEDNFNHPLDIAVERVIFNPRYALGEAYHDIALLELNASIAFSDTMRPICLPWGSLAKEELVGEEVTVAGWGRLSFGGRPSSVLQEVNVEVFDPSTCEQSYSTLSDHVKNFPQGMTKENIVCAGHEDGQKDACDGDSGGPMMHLRQDDQRYYLAGIISKGFGCGIKEFPGIYAPIRNFETLAWIKDVAFA